MKGSNFGKIQYTLWNCIPTKGAFTKNEYWLELVVGSIKEL